MKKYTVREYIFMALCCDLGLFSKRIIAPFTNIITDSLHIPGGVGTSFSLMFVVVAACVFDKFGSATIMSLVQSLIALSLGMVGSMGALSPVGYIVPGIVIDCVLLFCKKISLPTDLSLTLANSLGAVGATLAANFIVFHLHGWPFCLYIAVAATSGAICGIFSNEIVRRLLPVLRKTH